VLLRLREQLLVPLVAQFCDVTEFAMPTCAVNAGAAPGVSTMRALALTKRLTGITYGLFGAAFPVAGFVAVMVIVPVQAGPLEGAVTPDVLAETVKLPGELPEAEPEEIESQLEQPLAVVLAAVAV
jgi:hypothetical protein